MPVVIYYGSTIRCGPKGSIVFTKPLRRGMLNLVEGNKVHIYSGGKVILNGTRATFNCKNIVAVHPEGRMVIGDNFYANGPVEFSCKKGLTFGDNVLISVHVMILDTDYHSVLDKEGNRVNFDKEIIVGNKVWIGCNTTILKGTQIADNIIVGAASLVSGKLSIENSIYGGNPVRHVKSDMSWDY